MKNIVEVRNVKLGEGVPKIAVPLMGYANEDIIKALDYLRTIKFDIVEWRMDYYKDVEDVEKVKIILGQIRKVLEDIPLIATFRTAKEGGEKEITIQQYSYLNTSVAATGDVDLIDIELFIGNDDIVKELVDAAHQHGVKVIISNHDFYKTPEKDELVARMCKMQQLGADIPKIAMMPITAEDVLVLLNATNEMVREHSETPVITMSMGQLGVISRLAGETFGSALTFGSAKAASAPGQLEANELHRVLRLITGSKSI